MIRLLLFFIFTTFPVIAEAAKFKVFVVMSYEEKNPWCIGIKKGIASTLNNDCEIT
jgi:hypothetical protein